MNDMNSLVLGLGTIFALLLLLMWHRSPDSFDIRHLLVDSKTDRVSLMKCGQLMALLVSTWVLVRETQHDRLTEWLFTGYMVTWAGTNLLKRWIDTKKGE